ncbi:reprolysin-like metallopeptidase [Pseudoalteromonas luteoviolacea]|uniref:Peptidase M12B domain-containing protein n=1 Tax=Pseudoalteromonas luteoviolacea NCIMB 1942 TaxID=1365253 RepID=A0A167HUI6_9GAMM|nr:zinc-dependent metalloprotease family protein [Pseudoalteromonas luteoviolacea]KZN58545.1 hypothetical protein N482_21690 [Pseudoalteromonas luteoviolacea NCIMB 1942]
MVKSVAVFVLFFTVTCLAQSEGVLWSFQHYKSAKVSDVGSLLAHLNAERLSEYLASQNIILDMPSPEGTLLRFKLTPYSVMPRELQSRFPNIKTYVGHQIDNPSVKGVFDFSPNGFFGMYEKVGRTIYIDPITSSGETEQYRVYYKNALKKPLNERQHIFYEPIKHESLRAQRAVVSSMTPSFSTPLTDDLKYRLAITATGEYSQFHGGTKSTVMAALVTLVNRINQVYLRDLSTSFELVANNDDLIFLDPNTDPFVNDDTDIDELSSVIDGAIGVQAYDIGHLVGTGGGGLAGFGVACSSAKAEGVTGNPQPINDAFYIDYVAHEIGHQLGADHTYNGLAGACAGNRVDSAAFEPGSGSTIMAYTGICESQNLQTNSDPYFHLHSLEQMAAFTRQGGGSTCGTRIAKTNQAPVVNAGADFTIPARTPFTLEGSATDSDGDTLSFSWQQNDLGSATSSAQDDATDSGSGPLFRVFNPVETGQRTFPKLSDVLSGQPSYGEALPTTTRSLSFKLLVRDSEGNIADDSTLINVIGNQQGFSVIEPSADTQWALGQQTVQWDTAGTQNAPISCQQVDLLLSLDGGASFPTILADNVPNDGEQIIALAQLASSSQGKLKIECVNNIFFAMNSGSISINGSSEPIPPEITAQQTLEVTEDSSITLSVNNFNYAGGFNAEVLTIRAGENYTFTGLEVSPEANFNGVLSVPLIAIRGELTSSIFNAQITVTAVNDAPQAANDTFNVIQGSENNLLNVLSNDSDVDGDALTIGNISYQGNGNVFVSNNQVSYTPAQGFTGTEQLTYALRDSNDAESSAQVTITISTPPSSSDGSSGGFYYLLGLLMCLCVARYNVGIKT